LIFEALSGSPALALLLRLKLRGMARRQWRRLKTPKGLVLTLIGCAVFFVWMASLSMSLSRPPAELAGPAAERRVGAFGLMLLLLSLSTALTNRGLYLPKNEIERLFSAPLSRAQLVRYRLMAGGMRSLLGGVVLGIFAARRMPSAPLAFAGTLLAMQTLPVVNQLLAIGMGGLERHAAQRLRHLGQLGLLCGMAALAGLVFVLATDRPLSTLPLAGPWLEEALRARGGLLEHPWIDRALLPFTPWARMIAAEAAPAFAGWFLVCLGVHLLLIELCARLPVDFRELSLSTSARAAARVARVRRGGGVAATRASSSAARWRIPWLFGRGPAGALAWRKCAGMARKAKGAFWVALVALVFIMLFARLLVGDMEGEQRYMSPVLVAFLGTIYLCSGLRFDFREELERMDVVRSWPLAPTRVFVAMLLPEALLVALLVGAAVLLHSWLADAPLEHALGMALCLPMLVFDWIAVDNIVFLFAPVRTTPGQEGFFQNTGRRIVQMLLLFVLVGPPLVLAGLAHLGTRTALTSLTGCAPLAAMAAAYAAAALVLACSALLLGRLGGAVLRRFDVARDRG
jgi:putative ABC exporter